MTTSKTFIRDGTEVPSYGILFFGGKIDVDHLGRGLQVGEDGWIKFKSWARIGVLVNQLKRLLQLELEFKIEQPDLDDDVLNDSSLYCSESCQLKDQMTSITNQLTLNQQKKPAMTKPSLPTATLLRTKRSNAPSASYPWIPLYRRRRGVVVTKRCQPIVSSSLTTANAFFSAPKPATIV
ncbi:hypothetical protein PS6_004033 [Mucor atramentarius]